MKTWKQGIIGLLGIFALAFTLTACKDEPDNTPTEEPKYREAEIIFMFKDGEGNLIEGTYKATVKGTMFEADWNTAVTATQTRISGAQNATPGMARTRFSAVFRADENAVIIFDPNAGNGKLEVKDGEWRTLYINPANVNSITDAEFLDAVTAMRGEEEPYVALLKMKSNLRAFTHGIIAQWNKTFIVIMG